MIISILISSLMLSLCTLIPLSIKWELEKRLTIPAAVFIGLISGSIVYGIDIVWDINFYHILLIEILLIGIISSSLVFWRFYRDPERISPEDENAILSPADGKVIYIKKIEKGKYLFLIKKAKSFH